MHFIKLIIILRDVNFSIHFKYFEAKYLAMGIMAFKVLFWHKNRATQPLQVSLLLQPFIPNLQTSIHKLCVREKQDQAVQLPFPKAGAQQLSVTLTSLSILHRGLDKITSRGPFLPKPFCDSVGLVSYSFSTGFCAVN